LSRILNNSRMAAHHAVQMHHRNAQVVAQNRSRILRPARIDVADLVQQVVEVAPTTEDLQRLIDICARDIEDPGLEFAQVETEIRERTPFAGVLRFLSDTQNRTEIWTVLALLTMIALYILSQQQPMKVEVVAPKVDDVVEHVMDQIEHDQQPEPPPPTTAALDCKQDSPERKGKH
jgi:hypothetical protein